MIPRTFKVWFSNVNYEPEYETVTTSCQDDAIILANAERIKKGCDYTIFKIEEVK